jgi:ribosomal protein L37AE/L43A
MASPKKQSGGLLMSARGWAWFVCSGCGRAAYARANDGDLACMKCCRTMAKEGPRPEPPPADLMLKSRAIAFAKGTA